MDVKEKLQDIINEFKKGTALSDLSDGDLKESSASSSINLHFDGIRNEISVSTDDYDAQGYPL